MSNVTETLTDTVTLSDSASLSLGYSFTDSVSFSDAAPALAGAIFSFSDSVSFSDSEKQLAGLIESFVDSLGLSDFVVLSTFKNGRALLDSLTLKDSVSTFSPYVISLSDTLAFLDSSGITGTNFTDSVSLSDSAAMGIGILVLDSNIPTDSVNANTGTIARPFSFLVGDTLSLSDSIQGFFPFAILVGDSLVIRDAAGAAFISNPIPYLRRYLNDVI